MRTPEDIDRGTLERHVDQSVPENNTPARLAGFLRGSLYLLLLASAMSAVFVAVKFKNKFEGQMLAQSNHTSGDVKTSTVKNKEQLKEDYEVFINEYFTKLRRAYSDGDEALVKQLIEEFSHKEKALGFEGVVVDRFDFSNLDHHKRVMAIRLVFGLCNGDERSQKSPYKQDFVRLISAYRQVEKAEDMATFGIACRRLDEVVESSFFTLESIGASSFEVLSMRAQIIKKAEEEEKK